MTSAADYISAFIGSVLLLPTLATVGVALLVELFKQVAQ